MACNKVVLSKLKRWMKTNNPSYLAWRLGYRSTNVIENWISRKSIPSWIISQVVRIIENDEPNCQE